MRRRTIIYPIVSFFAVFFMFFFHCVQAPPNPYVPNNAKLNLLLESSSKNHDEFSINDTVGKILRIGLIYSLPNFIDSVRLRILSASGMAEKDTFFKVAVYGLDTQWCPFAFNSPGPRTIIGNAYVRNGLIFSDTGNISIYSSTVSTTNHKPILHIIFDDTISASQLCTLSFSVTDIDSGQKDSILLLKGPENYQWKDTLFTWTPTESDTGSKTLQFMVRDNGVPVFSDTQTILLIIKKPFIEPATVDTIPPTIRLRIPQKDSALTNVSSYILEAICKDMSGIDSVTCFCEGKRIVASKSDDSIWVAAISGLIENVFTPITIIASDKSERQNSDTVVVLVKFDPSTQDTQLPVFIYVNGPKNNERLTNPKDSLTYVIMDNSGLDSVYWTLNGKFSGLLKKQGNNDYFLPFNLTSFGKNRIVVHAFDKSTHNNNDSIAMVLNYNTKPDAIIISLPSDKAVGVDTMPTFSWTGGDDPDGDTVYFRVFYGKSISNLNSGTKEVVGKAVAISLPEKLDVYTRYYWKAVAYSKVFPDTIISITDSFTTIGVPLSITHFPTSLSINEGDTLTLSVTAAGTPMPNHYQWYRNDTVIANATNATYKKSGVLAVDAGQYHVVVSNGVSSDAVSTTTVVTVLCKYSVTYYGNKNTGGSVPEATTHLSGTKITIAPAGTLFRTGYSFFSWNTDSTGSGLDYNPGDQLTISTADVHLYARWKINFFTITFNAKNGTPIDSQSVKYGDTIKISTPPVKQSYTFDGWVKDTDTSKAWNFSTKITEPVKLYAKWVIRDIDSNIYTEVKIGNQVWMVENLKTTKYRDGSDIPLITDPPTWTNLSTPGYRWYEDFPDTYKRYGPLYNWFVVDPTNPKKVTPAGWHVPSDTEWTILEDYLVSNGYSWDGSTIGSGIAKALAAKSNWATSTSEGAIGNDLSKNNKSGFTALPAGMCVDDGSFVDVGNFAGWWTATGFSEDLAWNRGIYYENNYLYRHQYGYNRKTGFSVRCIRDY
jgi:uncharacterized protein (TIGR02145 family)/uncharacterized repeat protein (TIGR02543 family)